MEVDANRVPLRVEFVPAVAEIPVHSGCVEQSGDLSEQKIAFSEAGEEVLAELAGK